MRFLLLAVAIPAFAQLAQTPPMGWNSWDSYGLTISEDEFKANASELAHSFKAAGYEYAVVDEGWYLTDPKEDAKAVSGPYSFFLPAPNRFPSAATSHGFTQLADWVHAQGSKFGIHIIRGIPRDAVDRDMPIGNTGYRASAAADTSDTCSWNKDTYGVRDNAAGHAYYNELFKLYANWHLDFIKVDCISSPYKQAEIHMIHDAIRKSGREIVLSLSPGATPIEKASDVTREAQMWRISGDIWDHWDADPQIGYSPAVNTQFERAAAWAKFAGPGHWPDADMLPLGFLGPRSGALQARQSRLTHDEQQTLFVSWVMFRSPLMIGSNLTQMDEWLRNMLTNPELIAVNQHATGAHQVSSDSGVVVWESHAEKEHGRYLLVVNTGTSTAKYDVPGSTHTIRDLINRQDTQAKSFTIPSHGSVLLLVK